MGFDEAMEAEVQQEKPQYEEPEAQKALNGTYTTFFVRAFKEGEKPIVEQHQQVGYAANRASYLHFREGWNTIVYGLNPFTGIGNELRFAGKGVGYQPFTPEPRG